MPDKVCVVIELLALNKGSVTEAQHHLKKRTISSDVWVLSVTVFVSYCCVSEEHFYREGTS